MEKYIEIAFKKGYKRLIKYSFSKAIDVEFGIADDGRMAICLKASHGWIDWLINLVALPNAMGAHSGYYKEWDLCRDKFFKMIKETPDLKKAAEQNGVIIAGRSKGGAEALIIGVSLVLQLQYEVEVGGVDPANAGTRKYIEFAEKIIGKNRIHSTCYRNDIVPAIPFWLHYAGIRKQYGKRRLGLSIKDHIKATTDISVFS